MSYERGHVNYLWFDGIVGAVVCIVLQWRDGSFFHLFGCGAIGRILIIAGVLLAFVILTNDAVGKEVEIKYGRQRRTSKERKNFVHGVVNVERRLMTNDVESFLNLIQTTR